jgi:RNA polymerase sigma-70 factor (ECF subfamily)
VPSPSGDIETFIRVRAGDQNALKVLYYKYYERLTRTAFYITGDSALAEDLAQQTFILLWTKREELQIESDLYAYLRRTTANAAIAHMRKTARRAAIRSELPVQEMSHRNPEDRVTEQELKREVHAAVEALPDQCRAVFKLSRYGALTYQQIADTLDISQKTVENHMGRALKQLRHTLRQYLQSIFL